MRMTRSSPNRPAQNAGEKQTEVQLTTTNTFMVKTHDFRRHQCVVRFGGGRRRQPRKSKKIPFKVSFWQVWNPSNHRLRARRSADSAALEKRPRCSLNLHRQN